MLGPWYWFTSGHSPQRATNPKTGGRLTQAPAGTNPTTGQAAVSFFNLVGVLDSCEFLCLQRVGGHGTLLNGKPSEFSALPSASISSLDFNNMSEVTVFFLLFAFRSACLDIGSSVLSFLYLCLARVCRPATTASLAVVSLLCSTFPPVVSRKKVCSPQWRRAGRELGECLLNTNLQLDMILSGNISSLFGRL